MAALLFKIKEESVDGGFLKFCCFINSIGILISENFLKSLGVLRRPCWATFFNNIIFILLNYI